MRLRFRTLLLTVALLLTMSSTASACIYIPLLDPFHWLFGCGYGPGYGNCGYGGYGYQCGSNYPNPHTTHRIIDDWLGYGYLRNQEGTLGHYPFRGWGGCYQPAYHGLLNPCPPMQPAFAMPAPVMPPVQMAAPMQMPRMQMPMVNPCWDPCQNYCADPCVTPQVIQRPVPVTTWRPMTVDRGQWQRVWVPRMVTTMVPQTQYMMPQAPAQMQMPIMETGCGDDCGGSLGAMIPSNGFQGEMMQGGVFQGEMMPGMSGDAGCCGSDGISPQAVPSAVPETTMMMPMNSQYSQQYYSMSRPVTNWSPQTAWNPQTAWANPGMAGSGYVSQMNLRPRAMQRSARRMNAQYRQTAPAMAYNTMPTAPMYSGMMAQQVPQYTWQANSMPMANMPMATQYSSPYPSTAFVSPNMAGAEMMYQSMPSQTVMNPMMTAPMPVAGDIMGDHEFAPPATAAVPVIPNAFQGQLPLRPANLARPLGSQSASRYPGVVR